jgi:prepilin-type N-terminal cleavage/methylation domain-containing protein
MLRKGFKGVTLIELLVVVLIIGILSTLLLQVLTGQSERARVAAVRSDIKTLEIAAHRYAIDLGVYPMTNGIGTFSVPFSRRGNGYLALCLLHSTSGNAYAPSSIKWSGPYVQADEGINITTTQGTTALAIAQEFLDPWGSPYEYISSDYVGGVYGYVFYSATTLPATDPYFATETYYNPKTFQIISFGTNRTTDTSSFSSFGKDVDDITNFK